MSVLTIAAYSTDNRWFSAAMATTIFISMLQVLGYESILPHLFIASLAIFFALISFKISQLILFYKETLKELLNPEKTLNFFTIAGTVNLMGICFSEVLHFHATATVIWCVAVGFWLGISFFSFNILFLYRRTEERKIEDILHGGWLFAVVGTQSTALLGITIADYTGGYSIIIQLSSFALWSIGAVLYLIFISLIILRLLFYKLDAVTALSPYWMNTGAAAITALTGAALYHHSYVNGGTLTDLLPFLKGISLFFWSAGLWWLPFLVIMSISKKISGGGVFVFTVGYWEIALALGLFSYSTWHLLALFKGQYLIIFSACFAITSAIFWCFSSVFTIVHLVKSAIWIPINDLTIDQLIPYSFKLRGRIFTVKKVINEWLDQNAHGVLRKRYRVVINDNLTCQIFYDIKAKKWFFDYVN